MNEFTRNAPTHIEDLLTRMKNCLKQAYSQSQQAVRSNTPALFSGEHQEAVQQLRDLKKTDYFDRVQMRLKKLSSRLALSEFS